MEEIWKNVSDYEGLYKVSNYGKVKRLYKNGLEKQLKPVKGSFDYFYHSLCKEGKSRTVRIHRIVAKEFVPNPLNYNEVNHIDGNKENNIATNLEWCTRSHNMKHAYKAGLSNLSEEIRNKGRVVLRNKSGTYTKKVINNKTGEIFNTIKEAALSIGLKTSTLCAMLAGRNSNKTDFSYYNSKELIQ